MGWAVPYWLLCKLTSTCRTQIILTSVDSPNQMCPPSPFVKEKDPIRQRIRQGSRDEASAADGGRREDGTMKGGGGRGAEGKIMHDEQTNERWTERQLAAAEAPPLTRRRSALVVPDGLARTTHTATHTRLKCICSLAVGVGRFVGGLGVRCLVAGGGRWARAGVGVLTHSSRPAGDKGAPSLVGDGLGGLGFESTRQWWEYLL